MDPLQPTDPQHVGRFALVGRLGAGGMGRVYLGRTPEGTQAAVKVIRDDLAGDPAFRARFQREVSVAVSVAGLFTARVLDADPEGDPPWLATQFVAGPSLREAVHRTGPLGPEALLPLVQGLADALASIHAAGLVHRDLKPANVLLSPTGPKVIDFGIARTSTSTQLTGTGEIIGTTDFMAPEQVTGAEVGPPADVFALGSTLVFAATGRSPFAADQAAATLFRVVSTDPDLSEVPSPLRGIVRGCLAKDPRARPTAQQIAARLRAGVDVRGAATLPGVAADLTVPRPLLAPRQVTSAETLDPIPLPAIAPPARRTRRGPVLAAALALVAAGALTVAALVPGVAGSTVSGTPSPVAGAAVDPNDPRVRYVDRLCASGTVLVTLADAATVPAVGTDPAVLRRDFLTTVDRSIGILDTALADFGALRDEAPTPQIAVQFGQIVDEFTAARAAFSEARATVAASDPLQVAAYSRAVTRFGDGARNLAFAAVVQQGITLPPDYRGLADRAPSCAR